MADMVDAGVACKGSGYCAARVAKQRGLSASPGREIAKGCVYRRGGYGEVYYPSCLSSRIWNVTSENVLTALQPLD